MNDHKKLRELALAATPGPWEHDLDIFDPDEGIVAVVSNAQTDLLFTASTDFGAGRHPDGVPWTSDHTAERSRQWKLAHESQAKKDAAFIAALSPSTVVALLDEVERLRVELRCAQIQAEDRGNSYQSARQRLADVEAARDEACRIAYRMARNNAADMEETDRLDELRLIGKEQNK